MIKTGIENIKNHDLIRHNMVFFFGSLLIAIFSYLYYPVIGRMVSVAEFGEIQAIISIFVQLGIILTAFGYVVTNIVNNRKNNSESQLIVIQLEQITLFVCMIIFVVLCSFSLLLKSSLQFTSILPLILVGFLVVLNVPSTSRTYVLQGKRYLKEVSAAGIIFAAGKLIVSVVLITLGYDVVGVMMGYILAQIATLIYLLLKTKTIFPDLRRSFSFCARNSTSDKKTIKSELVYGIAILVLLSGITFLYTSDTIVLRLFFSPIESGMYSGISAVSRIVFFVTASVAGVLIATVKMSNGYKENLNILYKSFGLVTLIGGMVTLFFMIFPTFSITLLFGEKYVSSAYLLPSLAILMLVCSYNNLLICYEIALRRFKAIYIVAASILTLVVLLVLFHDTFIQVIISYLAANLMVFVLLSIHILKRKHHA